MNGGFDDTRFSAWLVGAGYRPQSASKYAADARALLRSSEPGRGVSAGRYAALSRARDFLLAWREESGESFDVPELVAREKQAKAVARIAAQRAQREQRERADLRSVDDAEWSRLWALVEAEEGPAARVIEVMMVSGLRVGDVLRIKAQDLRVALKRTDGVLYLEVKGGKTVPTTVLPARSSWEGLARACSTAALVAEAVAPGSRAGAVDAASHGAYKAVARLLAELAEEAGVTGRVHPHRLRRTVGVQTARDVGRFAAQKLLGHSKGSTTDIYLDETNVEVVREAQEALAKRRKGSK